MAHKRIRNIAMVTVVTLTSVAHAQVLQEFNMSDTVVTICKGILLDSEAGPYGELIYPERSKTISSPSTRDRRSPWSFNPPFCLEQGYDFLTFHNGPSINSPQLDRHTPAPQLRHPSLPRAVF